MKTSMLIKCDKCGYENFPQHRFCGMCAAELTIPPKPGTVAVPAAQPAVSRVADLAPKPLKPFGRPVQARMEPEPAAARNLSYLLEDEPPPSHRGRYVRMLVLLVAGVAAIWHWREDLRAAVGKISGSAPVAVSQTSSPVVDDQATGAAPVAPKDPAPQPDQTTPTAAPPQSDTGSAASVAQPANASDASANQPVVPIHSPKQARVARVSTPTPEDLEAEGEKYLYGNGVPENCGLARKSLLTAAGHSSAKAQNVLGTMYATGHCATRDLPTAYRWFGRALRQDPSNTRIEQDLKVLWNQMTPEEKQHTLRNNS
jgi:hypothetical protein